eukprot:c15335_g1_i2.p1 GENE.c15335_g1_i2~~c15335_g1_i2.p1  ORF type:complete len:239 (+),score=49.14 c15335_g1_i2:296-1012(+)
MVSVSLSVLKGFLFFLSWAIMIICFEGLACEYVIPLGQSPCSCEPRLRESIPALYYMFTTASTVGYGDLTPKTDLGRMLVVLFMVIAVYTVPRLAKDVYDQLKTISELKFKFQSLTRQRSVEKRQEKRRNSAGGANASVARLAWPTSPDGGNEIGDGEVLSPSKNVALDGGAEDEPGSPMLVQWHRAAARQKLTIARLARQLGRTEEAIASLRVLVSSQQGQAPPEDEAIIIGRAHLE